MTRTVVILACCLLNMMSASLLDRRSEGRLNCVSFSEPIFRSTSRTTQSPFFLNIRPFLSVFFSEAPVKPQVDAIYTPEPIEFTDTSPILHKVHKVMNNTTEDDEPSEVYFVQESSEEYLPIECYPEVIYPAIDVREVDDTSDEEDIGSIEKTSSGEEYYANTSDDEFDNENRGPVLFP